jgi:hypothetical protein
MDQMQPYKQFKHICVHNKAVAPIAPVPHTPITKSNKYILDKEFELVFLFLILKYH